MLKYLWSWYIVKQPTSLLTANGTGNMPVIGGLTKAGHKAHPVYPWTNTMVIISGLEAKQIKMLIQ
jgi:hypothetical protein